MLIDIKDKDLELAKHSNFLDDLDFCYSDDPRHRGIIVGVAIKSGCKVCWECGQPFVQGDMHLGEIEKTVRGATVPIYVHRRCYDGYKRKSFPTVMAGLRVRKAVAEVVKRTKSLLGVPEEAPAVVLTGDAIPSKPADPNWRFRRRVDAMAIETRTAIDGTVHATITELECTAEGFSVAQAEYAARSKAVEMLRAAEEASVAAGSNEVTTASLGGP